MEEIIIKEIDKKASGLVIVKYNGNREATLNTKWQAQEVDYLEKDVGIGGSVSVVITVKGDYTNITKVDMTSGKVNTAMTEQNVTPIQAAVPRETLVSSAKYDYPKDDKIVAQVILKCATEIVAHDKVERETCEDVGRVICNLVNELTGAYKLALENIKAL